ncbi:MAG: multicopper oxidase domain-containing protein [Nitrospirae bacterium]|nr:multicopper oxidase domain-containing protein [Nitrospirota bacterium]
MTNSLHPFRSAVIALALFFTALASGSVGATSQVQTAQEQRIEIIIRDYTFLLVKPATVRLGVPMVIILRSEDIVRHGFTSPMLAGLSLHGEGEGIASYGKGIEGFYVDPWKTLVIRFTSDRPGTYSFRCDLHPHMKGEVYLLEVPTA